MSTVSRFHELLQRCEAASPEQQAILAVMTDAPKFVFGEDVQDFIEDHCEEYFDALQAAVSAGHAELPFDPMVVENTVPPGDARNFWLLTSDGVARYRIANASVSRRSALIVPHPFFCWIDKSGVPQYSGGPEVFEPGTVNWKVLTQMVRRALFNAMTLHVRGIITRPPSPARPMPSGSSSATGRVRAT